MSRVLEALRRDHDAMIGRLAAARKHAGNGDRDPAITEVTALVRSLRAHMRVEEEILFPVAEHVAGDTMHAPIATLRKEHEAIRDLLADLERDLARGGTGFVANLGELEAALRLHVAGEERAIYPLLDRQIDPMSILRMAEMLGDDPT